MKRWCLTDHSFICFGSNAEALRYYYPINSGQFSQVRAFPPNNHEFCFVNILKAKHKGTHTFPSFGNSFFHNNPSQGMRQTNLTVSCSYKVNTVKQNRLFLTHAQ